MPTSNVINFPSNNREGGEKPRTKTNSYAKGSIYTRNGMLWVDFRYLGKRVRESSGLSDTASNRVELRKKLNLIIAQIENKHFQFADVFPESKKKDYFSRLEGRTVTKDPKDVTFGEYVAKWWEEMRPGMSTGKVRDYESIIRYHLLPYFGEITFIEFTVVLMKKFLAHLSTKKTRSGQPITAKRILNIFIPLRVITKDAYSEYRWAGFSDVFAGIKLPRRTKTNIIPFNFEEWNTLMKSIPEWYQPYFEFWVLTGLRPSEQVALKWSAIDEKFISIELSRVRGEEKTELKTPGSVRKIALRPSIRRILEEQKTMTTKFNSPYVFVNKEGRPILQNALGLMWSGIMKKSGLRYRRMYEIRHTFASWALADGELPEWVARTLGHADTSMVYRVYGQYIPNLKREDGSAFERQFLEVQKKNGSSDGHNDGHNDQNSGCQ